METITIQYDPTIPGLKGIFTSLLKLEGVKKVKTVKVAPEYDPDIVAKVKRGREDFRNGKCVTIKAEDIWN